MQGVGTALKVLFSPRKNGMPLYLSRMEIISLFNVLGRYICVFIMLDIITIVVVFNGVFASLSIDFPVA